MLLHQGGEGVGFKCIALVQLVFPPCRGAPMLQYRDGHSCLPGARTQTQVFFTWKMGRVHCHLPKHEQVHQGSGGEGGWGTHPYMMQPRVGHSRLPGAQTQTLASHEGWGCGQKKKRIWASSYPCSCFWTWAPLHLLIMGLESAFFSAVSNWV